jgi:hypothetical protein
MKPDHVVRTLLIIIAAFLGLIALRPLAEEKTQADSAQGFHFYIEPGTTTLRAPDNSRQVMGKVVVDLRTGKVWGFPTLGSQPYPMDVTKAEPPVSRPIYLGQYDFAAANR